MKSGRHQVDVRHVGRTQEEQDVGKLLPSCAFRVIGGGGARRCAPSPGNRWLAVHSANRYSTDAETQDFLTCLVS